MRNRQKNINVIDRKVLKKIIREELDRVNGRQQLNEQLEEGLMNTIRDFLGSAGDAILDRIANEMCGPVLQHFGVQRTSFLGRVICEAFENLQVSQITAFMRGDTSACQVIAQDLVQAIGEALVDELIEMFGVQQNTPMYRALVAPIIEMITNSVFRNTEFTRGISNSICNLDFSGIMQSAGVSGTAASGLMNALRSGTTTGSSVPSSDTSTIASSSSPTTSRATTPGGSSAPRGQSR